MSRPRLRPAVLVLAAALAGGCDRSTGPAPVDHAPTSAEWFSDVTKSSGVNFIHLAGTNYAMPDQLGSAVVVFDFDGDGRMDLYFVQNSSGRQPGRSRLFQQGLEGRFRDVSAGSGLDVEGRGMGAIAGDVNNDGRPDVVVTEYGSTRLFVNFGQGKFEEVTRASGLDNPRWAAPASFLDFDRDGWLDLVVGNYVDYDPTQICHDVQGRQDFCAPQSFGATVTRLWRNVTGKAGTIPRFEEVTERAGLPRAPGAALGLVCADFDGDGWPDIFCADDGRPNRLFLNRHDGTFSEEAVLRGLALNAMGRTAANMGVAFADVDGDGLNDVFVTHLSEEFHSLFRQDRRGWFTDTVAQAGLQQQAWRGTGFGTVLADFDLDGDLDLAFVNGLVRRLVPAQSPSVPETAAWWQRYTQRAQIFENAGGGRMTDVSPANPAFCGLAQVGRSLAWADLDGDGAPDLIVGAAGGPSRLFRNVVPRAGHWLKVRLVEPAAGGRDAIGAEAIVRAGTRTFLGILQPATSYFASHEPVLHFGLGGITEVAELEVHWPEGDRELFSGLAVDRPLILAKGSGRKLP